MLSLQGKDNKIVFIQVYFPTSNHPDKDVDELCDQIQKIIDNIPQRDFIFILESVAYIPHIQNVSENILLAPVIIEENASLVFVLPTTFILQTLSFKNVDFIPGITQTVGVKAR